MKLSETPIPGAYLVEYEPFTDDRGWFARTYDRDELTRLGLDPAVVQCSTSFNTRAGTLRGMHWQEQPHGEVKHVRCTRGAIFDVMLDMRPDSPTYCRWYGAELTPLLGCGRCGKTNRDGRGRNDECGILHGITPRSGE